MNFRDLVRGAVQSVQMTAGENASYTRGIHSVALTVLPGQSGFSTNPQRAVLVSSDQQDWLVPADQLVLNGSKVLPEKNDRITLTRDGETLVYEVLPPSPTEQPFRVDGTGVLLRIHTKRRKGTGA